MPMLWLCDRARVSSAARHVFFNLILLMKSSSNRCYTSFCPGNSWEYEDRGTTCGPIGTAVAKPSATIAGLPSQASADATPIEKHPVTASSLKSSAASKAGVTTPVASARNNIESNAESNAGDHSANVPVGGLFAIVAAALGYFLGRL